MSRVKNNIALSWRYRTFAQFNPVSKYLYSADLPKSKHAVGYTDREVLKIIGTDNFRDFNQFMIGQTQGVADDYKALTYKTDLLRYILLGPGGYKEYKNKARWWGGGPKKKK